VRAIYSSFLILSITVIGYAETSGPSGTGRAPSISDESRKAIAGGINAQAQLNQQASESKFRERQAALGRQVGAIDDKISKLQEPKARFMRTLNDVGVKVRSWIASGDAAEGSGGYDKFVAEHPLVKLSKEEKPDLTRATGEPAAPVAVGPQQPATATGSATFNKVETATRLAISKGAHMNPSGTKMPGVEAGDAETATPAAAVAQITNMMTNVYAKSIGGIKVPAGFEEFLKPTDTGYREAVPTACTNLSPGKCFNFFLSSSALAASTGFGAKSARSNFHVPKFPRSFGFGFEYFLEQVAFAADQVVGFFNGRVRSMGVEILMAKVAQERAVAQQDFTGLASARGVVEALSLGSNEAHQGLESALENPGFTAKGDTTYYGFAANELVNTVVKNSEQVIKDGLTEFNRLRSLETKAASDIQGINDQIKNLESQKQALQDQMNDPNAANDALGNNSGQGGDSGQGGTSGGGGSGGGAGGGGGGGQGLQAAKGAEPVKLESMKLPGFPDGGGLSQGLNGLTSPSNGFPDRGALPSGNFQMPKLESTRGAPTRTQPFSYASGAKNAGAGPQPQGKTGSPIGGGGGGNDAAAAAGAGGGGNPPVAGGGAPGSGGGGNVPNVGEGGGGGEERGTTASFVRTTDYGGGGGEGGAGAGPDNGGNEGGGIGAKIAAATGGAGAVGFAAREIKANPRARGMGLMAYVGGFRDFCSEKRALGVGACGASSRNDSGRAFKSPGSDPIGNLVAQRVNASASAVGSARGFNTITK